MSYNAFIRIFSAICMLSSPLAYAFEPSDNIEFKLVNEYHVSGEGRWDFLTFEPQKHRLFISRSNHVQVIDADSGILLGDIPGTEGVHGIALAEDLNVGFTSNGKSNSVTVFDLTTLNVIDNIIIPGLNPDAILYEPKSKHIYTFNGRSANATVIDALSRKVIATVSLPGKPELAVSNGEGKIFVNIEDKSELVAIDIATHKVVKTFSLGSGTEPTGLALDRKNNRLFSVCANNKMIILDSESGEIKAEVIIGNGPDSAAFDPDLLMAFSSNGDGTLTVIKESEKSAGRFTVSQNVVTRKGARTMAYDSDKHRAYLVTASFGETPSATKEQPKASPVILPNSFVVLVVALTH